MSIGQVDTIGVVEGTLQKEVVIMRILIGDDMLHSLHSPFDWS